MRRVIVTGAKGFIGRHSIQYLRDKNFEVHCVTTKNASVNDDKGVMWHRLDLLNEKECYDLFSTVRPSHLLHFAWYTEHGKYWTSDRNHDWVNASMSMLKHFKEFNGKRATFAGTCAEYDWGFGLCSEDTTPIMPKTRYGRCKNSLRQTAESFCKQYDISFSWGRIFHLFGPNEQPSRLVPSVILSLLNNNEAKCTDGTQIRDFLYSEDVASAFVSLLESSVDGAVNIASGEPVSVHDLVGKIGQKIGKVKLIRFGALPQPKDEPPLIVADIRKLKSEVCWKPKYDLEQGLDRTIEWWREHIK
ncbi:MAG: NAD(P)-dependent oxidoreductase [Thermoplasmata archaeon]